MLDNGSDTYTDTDSDIDTVTDNDTDIDTDSNRSMHVIAVLLLELATISDTPRWSATGCYGFERCFSACWCA